MRYSFASLIFFNLSLLTCCNSIGVKRLAVVIDVGSTGSRAHIFQWVPVPNACHGTGGVKIVLPEDNFKIRPGLATHLTQELKLRGQSQICNTGKEQQPSCIAQYTLEKILKPYLYKIKDAIDQIVPRDLRSKTPIWFLGTAGLRHLTEKEQSVILSVVYKILQETWDYKLHRDWIKVLDGAREGLFSWVVLNQLLRRHIGYREMENNNSSFESLILPLPRTAANFWVPMLNSEKLQAVTLVEFGGASTQVAVQAPITLAHKILKNYTLENTTTTAEDNNIILNKKPSTNFIHILSNDYVEFGFCGDVSMVFVKSYQGYGRQIAFQTYLRHMIQQQKKQENVYRIPCLPPDTIFPKVTGDIAIEDIGKHVSLDDITQNNFEGILGIYNGTFEKCYKALKDTLFDALPPIPFNVTEDVEITGNENIYHFHRLVAIPEIPTSSEFSLEWFRNRAESLCKANSLNDIISLLHPKAELEKAMTGCFGLTFMIEFLERIVGVQGSRTMNALSKILGVEVAWPAGYVLVELPIILAHHPEMFDPITNEELIHDEL